MHKLFILASVAAIFPLTQNFTPVGPVDHYDRTKFPFKFAYKNSTPQVPFFSNTKPATAWSQDWLATAQENIRKTEYIFSWQEKLQAYSTPNRKNNLRFFYNDKGFSVEPRTTQIPIDDLDAKAFAQIRYRSIANWKIKFDLDKKQVGKGWWKVTENKAEYIANNITVQYINNDEGMRQNFVVHSPLSKNKKLKINFNIRTKLRTFLHSDQLQFFHKKTNVLNYKELKVWDASGKILTASFKKNKRNKFYIEVDTKEAVYPITVDPISTTPSSMLESGQANATLGYSLASAGDVNGDGYSDVVVGIPSYDGASIDGGGAFIYHGSATGISITPARKLESGQTNARMGISVSTAGDVNNDGYSDIIIGAHLYDAPTLDEGVAFVYHGSATGISTVVATTLQSDELIAYLGISVACAGDVNKDGFSDVIVGSYLYDNGVVNQGAALVYHGSLSGINTIAVTIIEGGQANANLGISVAGAGDVNGDGFSDVIVGAQLYDNGTPDEGAAFIYHGSAAGINNVAVTTVDCDQALSQFGYSVSSAGDVNGDGYSDVIVGAYNYDGTEMNEGGAFIYYGSAGGINSIAAVTLVSTQPGAALGTSVACAGDINGDGYSDIITGAINYDNTEMNEGAAYIYWGSATGINIIPVILESDQAQAQMGRVASAGDVNGDGYSDIIVGVPQYDGTESNEGAAFVYHGSAAGINTNASAIMESNWINAYSGYSIASAGDVNRDGYDDVIIGAYAYDAGQTDEGVAFIHHGSASGLSSTPELMLESNEAFANFGRSVGCAGDVNGDGYSDVVVGADGYTNVQAGEGAVFVYPGSAAGINPVAAAIVESNMPNAKMGISCSGAGDVNRDGYSDIIAGAYDYDNGQSSEGAAFVYHGSATGIDPTPACIVEGNQIGALLGISVANAGDVNGDGYGDVVIGASQYDNPQTDEGVAFIYYGSATGINTSSSAILQGDQPFAFMGISVACAGDVNGDGYSDIIVGAPSYDAPLTDEGVAFIYHGSASGIITTAAAMPKGNLAGGEFGWAVASAGDVNGDGYSDIIVGADSYTNGHTNEGAAFIYNGSPTGINLISSAMVESNQASASLGFAVAPAGDVNGDGYGDVIAGAYQYNNPENNEGAAFLYLGNSPGNNKQNNLRLYNSDLNTPLDHSNIVFANFGAGLFTSSFLGRTNAKLLWETRAHHLPYSGMPITNSVAYTNQQAAYTDLGLAGTELKIGVNKWGGGGTITKLRVRVKYDPVKAITGQLYGPWRYVSDILDGNKLGVLPVELTSFKAAWLQRGRTAKISFTTDKENGICCFDIEKSTDGFNYSSIATIPARNVSGIQSYSFTDNNAVGKSQYYRLKIRGMQGQIEYSSIQHLQYDRTTDIFVFPNPATDMLQLSLNNNYGKVNVQIINSAGQLVRQMSNAVATDQILKIPVSNLRPGNYWIRLQTGSELQTLQFIKK